MRGDLPRSFFGCRAVVFIRAWRCAVATALVAIVLPAGRLAVAADNVPAPALDRLAGIRQISGCSGTPIDDFVQERDYRGRPAIGSEGRVSDGEAAGAVRDLAVYSPVSGRIVSYTCFSNASTRAAGEAIVSLAEASSRSDKYARALLPDSDIQLESIRRQRADGSESVYYEARYASGSGEYPSLEPPVRIILNATMGNLFRVDIDPDWLDPAAAPRVRITQKAAARVAVVVLRNLDLAPVFGPGAVLGKVASAERYTVNPNDWLGFFKDSADTRARAAWVVPFRVEGGAAAGLHSIFVDAATGRILGGQFSQPAGQQRR